METLQAAGVPAGAVLDGRDLHFDPQLQHRRLLEWVEFPRERSMGARRLIMGRPWHFSKSSVQVRAPAPTFGQHNRHVLGEILGYDADRIEALERNHIVTDTPKKVREDPGLTTQQRLELGRLAYCDRDYKKRLGME
jgi:crotonobetainyl-CoA:carnitine CoA-transferase CaiB-like acyl-CoA transferase